MRIISNEELMSVAGGESTTSRQNDGPAQENSITLDDLPVMPNYGEVSGAQYLACGIAIAKVDSGWTVANVVAAATTCAEVMRDLLTNQLTPTTLGAEQEKSDQANRYKANQY